MVEKITVAEGNRRIAEWLGVDLTGIEVVDGVMSDITYDPPSFFTDPAACKRVKEKLRTIGTHVAIDWSKKRGCFYAGIALPDAPAITQIEAPTEESAVALMALKIITGEECEIV